MTFSLHTQSQDSSLSVLHYYASLLTTFYILTLIYRFLLNNFLGRFSFFSVIRNCATNTVEISTFELL